jgi:hypothetical protein
MGLGRNLNHARRALQTEYVVTKEIRWSAHRTCASQALFPIIIGILAADVDLEISRLINRKSTPRLWSCSIGSVVSEPCGQTDATIGASRQSRRDSPDAVARIIGDQNRPPWPSTASPTGRPRALSPSIRKPVTMSSAGPDGRPLANGT